jgi:hypothetical protein
MSAPFEGKPVRTDADIARVVRALQSESAVSAGPLAAGVPSDHRLIVRTFKNDESARRAQRYLFDQGILSEIVVVGGEMRLLVDTEDRQRAFTVLDFHAVMLSDGIPGRRRLRFDLTLFGATMGAISGFVLLLGTGEVSVLRVVGVLIFVGGGAAGGFCLDGLVANFRFHRRLRFGVMEFLGLTFFVAFVIAGVQLVRVALFDFP